MGRLSSALSRSFSIARGEYPRHFQKDVLQVRDEAPVFIHPIARSGNALTAMLTEHRLIRHASRFLRVVVVVSRNQIEVVAPPLNGDSLRFFRFRYPPPGPSVYWNRKCLGIQESLVAHWKRPRGDISHFRFCADFPRRLLPKCHAVGCPRPNALIHRRLAPRFQRCCDVIAGDLR